MNIFQMIPDIEGEELIFVQNLIKDMDESQLQQFTSIYSSRRRQPMTILLMALVGFLGIAGIQRFYIDQIGMGLLFFFTGGLCLIGTIYDLISYKHLAFEYNQKQAQQVAMMLKTVN